MEAREGVKKESEWKGKKRETHRLQPQTCIVSLPLVLGNIVTFIIIIGCAPFEQHIRLQIYPRNKGSGYSHSLMLMLSLRTDNT